MPKVPQAHLERRRQQILDAAIACFSRKGFRQTTMADIADEAGVSDTLAYRYFSGKEAIIQAAVRQHEGTTVDELLGGADGVEDFRVLAEMLIDTGLRRFDQPEQMRMTMGAHFRSWAEALHDETVRSGIVDHWRQGFDIAEGLVSRAQRADQMSPELDPRAVAWIMLALHYGLNVLAALDREVDLEKCKDVMLTMTFGGFASRPGTQSANDRSREERGDG